MVSLKTTSKKYRGRMAANYETKRKKQLRWHIENDAVCAMLKGLKGTVLDCPVGTGRFLHFYEVNKQPCIGIDSSDEMLALAKKKKVPGNILMQGDATSLPLPDKKVDHAICIRFLDLIDEKSMQKTMQELMRVTKSTIICTIRFGEKYIPKSNTATHDKRKFLAMIKRKGWQITQSQLIFKQGWEVIKMETKS